MITNNGYLDGHIFRDLRAYLANSYSSMRVINLHGDTRKKEQTADGVADKNVFDIMQGVAIVILGRGVDRNGAPTVSYADLWGDRDTKYRLLASRGPKQDWVVIPSAAVTKMLVPAQSSTLDWDTALPLAECFGMGKWQEDKTYAYGSGFKSQQDEFAMAFTPAELVSNVETLLQPTMTEVELRKRFSLCNTNQWSFTRARERLGRTNWRSQVQRVLFRPFDFRFTVITADIVTNPRREIMGQLERPNLALLATRKATEGFATFVSQVPCGHKIVGNYDMTTVFPAYRYAAAADGQLGAFRDCREVNLSPSLLRALDTALGTTSAAAEDFIRYAYAVFYNPGYRNRYVEFLKIGFPRVPLPGSSDLFRELTCLGGELVALHLMGSPKLDEFITTYTGRKHPEVGRVSWSNNTVWLDAAVTKKGPPATPGSVGFRGVPEAVWNFHIGGYQVCEKWLKDRKCRTLSDDDIAHYQKIVVAIAETIRLMQEIDEVIERHGGWPLAFAQGNAKASDTADTDNVVPLPHPKSVVFAHQATPPSLQNAAEPEAPRYEVADRSAHGATPLGHDELDREDLICRIRHMFGDGEERERDAAIDALARELGYQDTASRIHAAVDSALRIAVGRNILANEGGALRLSARNIEQYERNLLKEQFLALLSGRPWVERDEAIRAFARWMGFRRTGRSIDETARSLINGLVREKRVERDGSRIRRSG